MADVKSDIGVSGVPTDQTATGDAPDDASPSGKKKPSGAQNRRRRREREAEAHELSIEEEAEVEKLEQDLAELLEQLGPPPLDPVQNTAWGNNLQAISAWAIVRDPRIPLALRLKAAKDHVAVIGLTHDRAKVAADIAELRDDLARLRRKTGSGGKVALDEHPAARRRARPASE